MYHCIKDMLAEEHVYMHNMTDAVQLLCVGV